MNKNSCEPYLSYHPDLHSKFIPEITIGSLMACMPQICVYKSDSNKGQGT